MNQLAIKPIETVYKGYRFRSRLEARWAVFFDAMNIKWEYELEGYDLGFAGWYLPDFYLPVLNSFAEVKSSSVLGNPRGGVTQDAVGKAIILSLSAAKSIVFLVDTPQRKCYTQMLVQGLSDDPLKAFDIRLKDVALIDLGDGSFFECQSKYDIDEVRFDRISVACNAARSARFEFGESGAK